MSLWALEEWWDEHDQPPNVQWGLKRLSANDTQATGSHQAGPLIPKEILFQVVPSLNRPEELNPDVRFELIVNDSDARIARAVWYNNKLHNEDDTKKTRNETRITRLGGRTSALLDPESTGAVTVFVFWREMEGQSFKCHIWVSQNEIEQDFIEDRAGPVPPGHWVTYPDLLTASRSRSGCALSLDEIPEEWMRAFPNSHELVQKAIEMRQISSADVDHRLLARLDCESEIFRSLENAVYMPRIQQPFESVGEFDAFAWPISQRRRSREARSLKLHLRQIFLEENLQEGKDFSWKPTVDSDSHPDFLFPNAIAYADSNFPSKRLRILTVKISVRERWRQVLKEATRVKPKHILTLQEGVSVKQFEAMLDEGIQLVVPKGLHSKYPREVQPYLQTLESFIAEVREQAR